MNEAVFFWIMLAVILGIIESMTISLVSIWAAISALFCAVLSAFGLEQKMISLIFIILTAALLVLTRPVVKRFLNNKTVATNLDRIILSRAEVIKGIKENAPGQINVKGQIWTAISYDGGEIPEGKIVEIVSIEGVKAVVKEI